MCQEKQFHQMIRVLNMEIQKQPVMLLHCGVEIIRQYLSGGDQHNQFNQCQFCCH